MIYMFSLNDKPKDTGNSSFEASSVLVVKVIILHIFKKNYP